MKFAVPDDIIKETKRCSYDFSCVETGRCGNRKLCRVQYADGKNVLFLTDRESANCPHRVSFAYGQICVCPTHYAIFNKYNR